VLGIEDDNKNEGRNHEVASVFMIDWKNKFRYFIRHTPLKRFGQFMDKLKGAIKEVVDKQKRLQNTTVESIFR
jgi:hypothetical protein